MILPCLAMSIRGEKIDMARVTLEDIAKACNVTKGLVSRSLAGKYNVSEEMRLKIAQKAAELGYDMTHLRKKKEKISRVLLVISSRMLLKEDYWQPIIKSLARVLDMNSISLEYFVYDDKKIEDEQLKHLISLNTNAYVIIHNNPENIVDLLRKTGKNIVEVDPKLFHSDGITKVKFSNYDSTYLAVETLIENKHKTIAFYGSDMHSTSFRERHEGFLSCINTHASNGVKGISIIFDNKNLHYSDDALLEKNLKKYPITALICANDIIAERAYAVIYSMGKKIPDDISVIGFDNIKSSSYLNPPLSTYNVPREELGKEVANYLIGVFKENQLQFSEIVIRCSYVSRDSVKKIN